MTMDPLQNGALPLGGARPSDGRVVSGADAGVVRDPKAAAAFKALLEKLEEGTRRLSQASDEVDGARDLAGAVGVAGESIQTAIQLGDEILEAYRAARQRDETGSRKGA